MEFCTVLWQVWYMWDPQWCQIFLHPGFSFRGVVFIGLSNAHGWLRDQLHYMQIGKYPE